MAQLLTTFDPTNPTSGNFVASFLTGCGTLHVKNASAVDVLFMLDNSPSYAYVVQAGEPRDIPVPKSRSKVFWSQQNKLNTNSKQIQSVVYVESYEKGEVIPASQALARHQNTTQLGFSAILNFGGAAGNTDSWLFVFNPATSGNNATFYEALVNLCFPSTLASGGAQVTLGTRTTDPGSFAVSIANHDLSGPASTMVSEFSTGNTSLNIVTSVKFINFQQNISVLSLFNFISTLDQVKVPPGQGLGIEASIPANTFGSMFLSWTETPV